MIRRDLPKKKSRMRVVSRYGLGFRMPELRNEGFGGLPVGFGGVCSFLARVAGDVVCTGPVLKALLLGNLWFRQCLVLNEFTERCSSVHVRTQ